MYIALLPAGATGLHLAHASEWLDEAVLLLGLFLWSVAAGIAQRSPVELTVAEESAITVWRMCSYSAGLTFRLRG